MTVMQTTADAEALLRRAAGLIEAGRSGIAGPLLAAARRLAPQDSRVARLAGQMALRDGAIDTAANELNEAVRLAPADAEARKLRAELRQRQGDPEGATRDAAEAVFLNPRDPDAKALLGVLLLQIGRAAEAIACLREAISEQPRDPAFREMLATAQVAAGDPDAALETLQDGIAAVPASVVLRNAAILHCIRWRDFAAAERLSEAARAAGIADASTFGLRGHALSSLGRHSDAAEAYADALKLAPDDPYVRHLAAAGGVVAGGDRAPEAYVRDVFDGYAERFDGHLIALQYRIPGTIRSVLLQHPRIAAGHSLGPGLDLGCGTGLVALALSDLPIGPMTGVDLSPRMLEQAAAKSLYAELREADLMTALSNETESWPLILAADVLCYFGALERVLAAVFARLDPGGWFIFSAEELLPHRDGTVPGNGQWALLRQGRYVHGQDYLTDQAAAAGLRIGRLDHEAVRCEGGAPVAGFLMVLERPA